MESCERSVLPYLSACLDLSCLRQFLSWEKACKKPWEWTPASLGVSRTRRWKLQQMEVAASGACSLSCDSPATPPKHVRATVSKGISSSVGCWAEALLARLLWSNHLMRTFGLRGWRFLHGRLSWAAGMHCKSPIRWFSAALIWSVCDSEENMKVTCSSSPAYVSWAPGSSIPCRMHPGAWLPVFLSLGTLCAAPAFPCAVGAVLLSWLVPCIVGAPSPLGCFPAPLHPCRAAAAAGEQEHHGCAPGLCCRFSVTCWGAAPHLL